ncbi:IclR family transcriptional regulator [Modestobacter roseus]|uniref:IclR family transcriptional regulator n=1 Tax=Modestobacter roseus TaxID=1181884 RepID=UPI0034DFDFC2
MPGNVQAVERAAAILQAIAGSGGRMGVTELAGAVGLPKTTTHGLLRTLLGVGFVAQDLDSGRYTLGPGLLGLGSHRPDANELRSRASNWTDALASRSGCAVRLGTLTDGPAQGATPGDVLVVHHVFRPDDSAQELEVGRRLPAHATALGKVLLACLPGAPPIPAPAVLARLTRATCTDPAALTTELRAVRHRGWAGQREEHTAGVAGLAAPVHGPGGLVVCSLGLTGPVESLFTTAGEPRPALLGMLTDSAAAVTRELSHR